MSFDHVHGGTAAHRARWWCHHFGETAIEGRSPSSGRCNTSRRHGNRYQSRLRVAGEVGSDEHVLAAMADAHGGVTRSHMIEVVAVK